MPYATRTTVPVSTTRADIEKALRKAKAYRVITMHEPREEMVAFRLDPRAYKRGVALPADTTAQHRRSTWSTLLPSRKARLAAVEQGISTVEREFLGFLTLPDGRTAGEWLQQQIERSHDTGQMPPLQPPPKGDR